LAAPWADSLGCGVDPNRREIGGSRDRVTRQSRPRVDVCWLSAQRSWFPPVAAPSYSGSPRIGHAMATPLVNKGMPLEEVSRYLGHSSTDVTRRYARQTPTPWGGGRRTPSNGPGSSSEPQPARRLIRLPRPPLIRGGGRAEHPRTVWICVTGERGPYGRQAPCTGPLGPSVAPTRQRALVACAYAPATTAAVSSAATSISRRISSPTSQPPASRAMFQVRPQSLRLSAASKWKPARRPEPDIAG